MGHLRRYSLGSLLVSLLALTAGGEPPTPTAELEARLAVAVGEARRDVLVELTHALHREDPARAVALGGEAFELLRSFPDQDREIALANTVARAHHSLSDSPSALEHASRAEELARDVGAKPGLARALANRGRALSSLGELEEALQVLDESITLYEEIGDESGLGDALNQAGVANRRLGNFPEALELGIRAFQAYEAANDIWGTAVALNSIGIVHQILGEYTVALEYYERALAAFEEAGSERTLRHMLGNIGNVYQGLGQLELALDYQLRALAVSEKLGDEEGVSIALLNVGIIHEYLGEPERAVEPLRRSLRLGEKHDAKKRLAFTLNHLAVVERQLGEHEAALETGKRSLALAEQIGAKDDVSTAHLSLSETYAEMGRYREAQSEKMAALGQLVAGVAHEINNPVNFLSSGLPLIERDFDRMAEKVPPGLRDDAFELLRQRFAEVAEAAGEGAHRTAEIVRDLRTFSRLDEADLKQADLHESLDVTLSLLTHRTRDRIRIEKRYGELPQVECYAGELNQVFMNLLTNAVQAIDGDGTITVVTDRAGEDGVRISVTDTGCGMGEEVRGKLFDPFFTTKPVGQGTGLGLSISHGIVARHGGTIEVESEPGEGSTFTVVLPLMPVEGRDLGEASKR